MKGLLKPRKHWNKCDTKQWINNQHKPNKIEVHKQIRFNMKANYEQHSKEENWYPHPIQVDGTLTNGYADERCHYNATTSPRKSAKKWRNTKSPYGTAAGYEALSIISTQLRTVMGKGTREKILHKHRVTISTKNYKTPGPLTLNKY